MLSARRFSAPDPMPERLEALQRWLSERLRTDDFELIPASADASFRRYFRARQADKTWIAMDAPPDRERPQDFIAIAERLHALDLSAPRIEAAAPEQGFLLLEDLGDRTFTRALAEGHDEAALYRLATDTLIALQQRWRPDLATGLPPYDETALLREASLLIDWYLPAVTGRPTGETTRQRFVSAWRSVLPGVDSLPRTLVLRDYHVDNLMVLPGRAGVAACGLLDFQDALLGSPAYDLVSLLRDARRDVPDALQKEMLARYLAAFPSLDHDRFETAYWVLGAQRTTKIIGIFTRLAHRDGKPDYLRHMPRLWRLLGEELAHPMLEPVHAWYEEHLPATLRIIPATEPA
ncbi:MAG: phosphotransferase [Gammaproteobacteria bacterium]|jgi:aminoglycoside/choline kinase family phosphotransferase